jgi:hypothetical protein
MSHVSKRFSPVLFMISALLVVFALSACSPLTFILPAYSERVNEPAQAPAGEYQEDIVVDSLQILMLESFPVQVQVEVDGLLPDACSFIEMVEQTYGENEFNITLHFARHPNMRCAPQPTAFQEIIALDVHGLKAGEYTVSVHGVEASFELPVDNILDEGQ